MHVVVCQFVSLGYEVTRCEEATTKLYAEAAGEFLRTLAFLYLVTTYELRLFIRSKTRILHSGSLLSIICLLWYDPPNNSSNIQALDLVAIQNPKSARFWNAETSFSKQAKS